LLSSLPLPFPPPALPPTFVLIFSSIFNLFPLVHDRYSFTVFFGEINLRHVPPCPSCLLHSPLRIGFSSFRFSFPVGVSSEGCLPTRSFRLKNPTQLLLLDFPRPSPNKIPFSRAGENFAPRNVSIPPSSVPRLFSSLFPEVFFTCSCVLRERSIPLEFDPPRIRFSSVLLSLKQLSSVNFLSSPLCIMTCNRRVTDRFFFFNRHSNLFVLLSRPNLFSSLL